ncbi:MAG: hypothetical protein HPM95_02060 [Alphaproteobacteria bacterium]|nr:hypothetical protein [Alphaproteobacteria bacterium]
MSANGFRLDTWDVFLTDRDTALAACRPIVERGLPDGLAALDAPLTPEGATTRRIQAMMSAAGVVPFPAPCCAVRRHRSGGDPCALRSIGRHCRRRPCLSSPQCREPASEPRLGWPGGGG